MNLAKGFSGKTVATGKISFGLRRTNIMKANIHWDQDFSSISWTPSLIGINNAIEFCAAIEAARQREMIRNHSIEESFSLSKAADPGKLKRQEDFITWYRALKNYMPPILCQGGFPLRYVMRESAAPYYTIYLQPYCYFEMLLINCVPFTGLTYKTDARKVYQLIHGFVQGETKELVVNPKESNQDG